MKFIKKLFGFSNNDHDDQSFLSSVNDDVKRMQVELEQLIRASAEAISHHNRLEAEYQKLLRQADDWKSRAKEALGGNDESLARQALARKVECQQSADEMKPTVESSRLSRDQLTQQISQLKRQIAEAERSASTLVARRNAAKAQQKMADAMAGLGASDGAFNAISKYEEQVLQQEAQAKVWDSLSEDRLSMEDNIVASGSPIEDELEALKKEMP